MMSLKYYRKETKTKSRQERMAAAMSACSGGAITIKKKVWMKKHSALLDLATADHTNPLTMTLLPSPPK